MKLYGFFYNYNTWESSDALVSLHKTKEGAVFAMESHKKKEFERFCEWFKDGSDCVFGSSESWRVEEVEVLD